MLRNELGRRREAVAAFRTLIAGGCDDQDRTGALMDPFRNHRYPALLQIAATHMELDEPAQALPAGPSPDRASGR